MLKQFDFTNKNINTDYLPRNNNQYNEFNQFDFAYEKINKPNILSLS